VITVEGLTKSYAAIPALKGISFEVADGEVTGFLGPNGAGKTTTLRILSGFMPATAGTVRVAGHDVRTASREVRRRVGYLPEDVPLYRDMTVRAFLAYMAGLKEVPAGRVRSEVGRVMERTGLVPMQGRHLSKCSRGYRQRTGLAMAMLGDPPVLLLDEPTSGLDPNQAAEVRRLIHDLSGEKTVLLSTHILSEVDQICSRILIVHEGRLVASGATRDLERRFRPQARLRIRAAVDPAVLRAVEGVSAVEPEDGGIAWLLSVPDAEAAAPRVARAVLEAGGDLYELGQERSDLEGVFRAVTRDA
jgi:ABC-2 type transport system ATP-binding protein